MPLVMPMELLHHPVMPMEPLLETPMERLLVILMTLQGARTTAMTTTMTTVRMTVLPRLLMRMVHHLLASMVPLLPRIVTALLQETAMELPLKLLTKLMTSMNMTKFLKTRMKPPKLPPPDMKQQEREKEGLELEAPRKSKTDSRTTEGAEPDLLETADKHRGDQLQQDQASPRDGQLLELPKDQEGNLTVNASRTDKGEDP